MDTRWKNKQAILIILLLFSFGCSLFFTNANSSPEFLKKNYFNTNRFHSEYNTFLNYLAAYQLTEYDEEELKKNITVTEEEINDHRYEYGDLSSQVTNIKEQYKTRIEEAKIAGNLEVAAVLQKELDTKIKDITENFTSDEHVRQKIIAQKEKSLKEELQSFNRERENSNPFRNVFEYYLEDINSGEIYTSLSKEEVKSYREAFAKKNMHYVHAYANKNLLQMEGRDIVTQLPIKADRWYNNIGYFDEPSYSNEYGETYNIEPNQPANRTFKGYIGVSKDAPSSSQIVDNAKSYQKAQIVNLGAILVGLIAIISSLLMLKRRGLWDMVMELEWKWYSRIPIDIRLAIILVTGIYTWTMYTWSSVYDYGNVLTNLIPYILISMITMTLALLQIGLCLHDMIRNEIQAPLIIRMIESVKAAFLNRKLGMQMFILLILVPMIGLGIGFLLAITNSDGPFIVLIFGCIVLFVGLPVLYLIFKQIGYLNQIIQAVSGIVYGKNEPDLKIKGNSALAEFARDVNLLKYGVKTSQKEQVKSERLKTELITNVSHDLRTPLTSIITYSDLLKSTDLTEEDRQSYIEIIDRKSKRLKVLIDDLFEASKMASGNIELEKRKVDVVQLVQQTLAEHDEEIRSSQLQFRVSNDAQPIEAVVDGQKLYRVFDNLVLNILKYSLPNTRVYIAIKNRLDEVEISFKNVSQFELGENVDELFERFKRGDQSRQTEGSGLGLAIAKSIIDLHQGEMDIDVDGDLFKVTITLSKKG